MSPFRNLTLILTFVIPISCSNFLDTDGALREYREAEEFGRGSWSSDACMKRYAGCPFSVFSIVSLFSSRN